MTDERKTFTQYGYNPYQQQSGQQKPGVQPSIAAQQQRVELKRRNRGLPEKIFGEEIAGKMRTPLFATVALLTVGVAFAAVVAISYPSGSGDAGGNVPVVTAQSGAFKASPGEEGGVSIAHQDSTVFDVVSSANPIAKPFEGDRPVENLLEPAAPVEEAVDTLEAFSQEAQEAAQAAESAVEAIEPAAGDLTKETPSAGAQESIQTLLDVPQAKEEPIENLLKDVDPKTVASVTQTREKVPPQDLVRKGDESPKQPEQLHAAGSSPDTIAFVRSVLDQKDNASKVANAAAAVEPASGGNALKAPSVTPGNYYVQLGSVTSRSGADSEWTRFTKSLPIKGLDYRVQEANLGERGTYYRIQAGPMSKASADELCGSIKAQKPGGCLVVK